MQLVHYRPTQPNFGDDLNALLWPSAAPALFEASDDAADRSGFLGIGTIIGMPTPGCDFLHVFSSGAGYDPVAGWDMPRRIWCVRGPLTAELLDCPRDLALSDGAILTPRVLDIPRVAGAGRIGVMPHWESLGYPGWREACAMAGYSLISPCADPASVIGRLRGVELLLTESLHGAILADTYGIPWVPITSSGNFSLFKWTDWCLSVEVAASVTAVPPPSARALLRFGKPGLPWGGTRALDREAAMADLRGKVPAAAPDGNGREEAGGRSPKAALKALAKDLLHRHAVLQRLLGLDPARTAEALVAAARQPGHLSSPALRAELQDRMLDRLEELSRVAAVLQAA
ncbi:polysaccharide pyruvyl transferase family protein [Roseomonas sp. NAR14]|uniref:Polysaccharide pyruvyl transferase family protein n=1 Tax=Roseomonas acroporae TaxID=2937791 RepID=A0A9X1Y714_9PROT|nr:polysaccharide pyruvyl transferase family protein [Roseomonas acroporae]MCK8783242.1 polysaccharide pyruvyl transferase family protein [Roseomonas acroporae]